MNRLIIARTVCKLLSPLTAQRVRNLIFPISEARRINADFGRKSVTGSVFFGNMSDYHSYRMAVHGYFEWRNIIIARHFTKNSSGDIIEIGSNVGTETISFCDVCRGTVHAFEPMPDNIRLMELQKPQKNNLKLYHNAVSDKEMTVSFKMPPTASSGTGKIVTSESTSEGDVLIDVKAAPLDCFIENFQKVKFVSIDTEGHEPFVLKGAKKTFEAFRPAIIIEVTPSLLKKYANAEAADIFSYFDEIGYKCYGIDSLSLNLIKSAEQAKNGSLNWLCVPREAENQIGSLQTALRIRAIIPWYLLPKLA